MSKLIVFIFSVFFLLSNVSQVIAAHGISIDGSLKYPKGFKQFSYTSKKAVKGGEIVLHDLGSFDKLNPFTLKGLSPLGIEMLIFETLAVSSLDEPFAEYGLLAKDITLAADKMSVTFTLDERARFSDNTPVTATDVKYSLEIFKSDKVHPRYPYYYQDIDGVEILDEKRVRFNFKRPNRELHMICGQLPILSSKFYQKHGFNNNENDIFPIGSGPYIVAEVDPGKSITYKRNPDYWAVEHPVRKGQYNFDKFVVNYYKDQIVSVEALKAGEFDFMLVNIAKQWARDLKGKHFEEQKILKKIFPHKNNAGMQGFVMNTRRDLFKNPKVREAIGLALDFEWTNKSLFFNQYSRSNSYFSNSHLAATGLPGGLELKYLEPLRKKISSRVFTSPLTPPSTKQKGGIRANLRKANKLLKAAGWTIKDGELENKDGKEFAFEIMLVAPSFERVMAPYVANLEKLGMKVDYRTVDAALYTNRLQKYDFDMPVTVYAQSQSPGNEQRNFWHSQSAQKNGTRNLAGIDDPAIDDLVEKIIYARTEKELIAATKALDRVLWYGYYVVPNWYMAGHRLVYHNHFGQPDTLPLYYGHYQLLLTWWDKRASIK